MQLASNEKSNSVFSIQVELLDDEEVSSKSGSEVDEKRGGEVGGGEVEVEVEGVVRLRSGVSEPSEGSSRVRGLSESEERRGVSDAEASAGAGGVQPFILAVSVAPEGKGGPKRFACQLYNCLTIKLIERFCVKLFTLV